MDNFDLKLRSTDSDADSELSLFVLPPQPVLALDADEYKESERDIQLRCNDNIVITARRDALRMSKLLSTAMDGGKFGCDEMSRNITKHENNSSCAA